MPRIMRGKQKLCTHTQVNQHNYTETCLQERRPDRYATNSPHMSTTPHCGRRTHKANNTVWNTPPASTHTHTQAHNESQRTAATTRCRHIARTDGSVDEGLVSKPPIEQAGRWQEAPGATHDVAREGLPGQPWPPAFPQIAVALAALVTAECPQPVPLQAMPSHSFCNGRDPTHCGSTPPRRRPENDEIISNDCVSVSIRVCSKASWKKLIWTMCARSHRRVRQIPKKRG